MIRTKGTWTYHHEQLNPQNVMNIKRNNSNRTKYNIKDDLTTRTKIVIRTIVQMGDTA